MQNNENENKEKERWFPSKKKMLFVSLMIIIMAIIYISEAYFGKGLMS